MGQRFLRDSTTRGCAVHGACVRARRYDGGACRHFGPDTSPLSGDEFMNAPTHAAALAPSVKLLIGGQLVESESTEWREVVNPATQQVLARVPFATAREIDAAVAAAKEAFKTWKKTPIGTRARIFLKYQQLIREHMAELAALLTAEQGKTLADAEGDVFRGLEVVEHAAGIGNLQLGELANNVATGVDTYTLLQPLGVCAGTAPFNFPTVTQKCMFPLGIT